MAQGGLKFLLDNNLSRSVAMGMKAFGENVSHVTEVLPENVEDEKILEYVGKHGIVLITRDGNLRRRPAQVQAIKKHKVIVFIMIGKRLDRCRIVTQLVNNWQKIKEKTRHASRPDAYKIPSRGTYITRLSID